MATTIEVTANPEKDTYPNNNGGKFERGKVSNPVGRPKGSCNLTTQFLKAMKTIEDKKSQSFFTSVIERAYHKDSVAMKVLDKILPNAMPANTGSNGQPLITLNVLNLTAQESGQRGSLLSAYFQQQLPSNEDEPSPNE